MRRGGHTCLSARLPLRIVPGRSSGQPMHRIRWRRRAGATRSSAPHLKSATKSAWGEADRTVRPFICTVIYLTTNFSRPPSASSAHGFRTLSRSSPRAFSVCTLFRQHNTCASKCPATVESALRSSCSTIVMWSLAGCTTLRLAEFWMYRHRGRVMLSSSQPVSRAR